MKFKLLSDKIYAVKSILSNLEFNQVIDEFNHNQWVFDKKELIEDATYPIRGSLKKNNSDLKSLGDNYTFIKIGSKLKYKVSKLLHRNVELIRINTNIQFFGQESSFHKDGDDGSWTLVLFCNFNWNSTWGGEFVVRNLENDYFYVAFIPNNGVLIPGWLDHTGMAPNRLSNQPRISLAFTFQEF